MKKVKLLVFSLILIILTGCSGSKMEYIGYDDYKKAVDNSETFIVEVMSTDCPHCESLKPKLTEVVKKYDINLKVIDVSKLNDDEKTSLKKDIGSLSTPTIIFYKDGEESSTKTRIVGDVSKDKLIEKFKENGYID